MKIVQFTAENIKKLKVVDITPTKDFIQVTGKNGSGKTSVLDSIWWALAGKDAIQDMPIRSGEEKAMIRLDLGSMVITRRFTQSGTTLSVENSDGFKASSPQALLDAIIGHLTFDPLEFARQDPKKQFEVLRKISECNVDFEAIAKADKADYDARRDINRDIKSLEAQLEGITVPEDAPDGPVDTGALLDALQKANAANAESDRADAVLKASKEKVERIDAEIVIAEANLKALKEQREKGAAFVAGFQLIDKVDTAPIEAEIATAQARTDAYQAKARAADIAKKAETMRAESQALTVKIEHRAKTKMEALNEAKMPIEGLSLEDGVVLFKGIPFGQLSAAEQLRISVSIAMDANPKLKVIRIKDGSLLDDDAIRMIQEAAAERDFQVWCEVVDGSGKVGVYLEDGEIKSINGGVNA